MRIVPFGRHGLGGFMHLICPMAQDKISDFRTQLREIGIGDFAIVSNLQHIMCRPKINPPLRNPPERFPHLRVAIDGRPYDEEL
jgi:hypothetical protein